MIVFKPFEFIWIWEWADLEGADLRRRLFRMLNWSFFLNPFHNKNHMNWHNEAKTTRINNYTIMSPPKGDHLQPNLCIYYPWIWYFFKLTWAENRLSVHVTIHMFVCFSRTRQGTTHCVRWKESKFIKIKYCSLYQNWN